MKESRAGQNSIKWHQLPLDSAAERSPTTYNRRYKNKEWYGDWRRESQTNANGRKMLVASGRKVSVL